ncbi:transposase [Arthrobacter sp. PvP102]|uniref:transposase n=1 Tax=unclassified Arthrobacter TaxID=235627 RepID=UPI0035A866C5
MKERRWGGVPDLRQGLRSYGFLRPLDGSFTSDDHAQKKYDAAFHEDAVRLDLSSDRSVKQVAEEIGVKKSTLGN